MSKTKDIAVSITYGDDGGAEDAKIKGAASPLGLILGAAALMHGAKLQSQLSRGAIKQMVLALFDDSDPEVGGDDE
jgi:hypothetical protein